MGVYTTLSLLLLRPVGPVYSRPLHRHSLLPSNSYDGSFLDVVFNSLLSAHFSLWVNHIMPFYETQIPNPNTITPTYPYSQHKVAVILTVTLLLTPTLHPDQNPTSTPKLMA